MSDNIKISVIIPYFHNSGTIDKAIKSVECEGYNFEIVLVDASLTFSEDRYSFGEDLNFRVVKGDKHLEVAEARNLGVSEARGEYVSFLDADDWWEKGKLKKQIELMESVRDDKVRLCFTARRLCTEDGRKTKKVIGAKEKVDYKTLLKSNFISCSSVMLRRSTALKYPMKCGDIHEDYLCWIEMLRDGGIAAGIDIPFLNYRSYKASRSGKKINSAIMTYYVYKKAGISFPKRLWYMITYTFYGIKKYV